jgi:hypothetical protein
MAGSSLASTLTRPRVNYLPSLGRKRKEKDDITPIRPWGDHSSTPTGTHCDESFQNLRWRRHTVLSPLALLDHGLCNTYNLRWVHACMLDIDLFAAGWACCPGWNGRLHACMVLGDLCPSLVIISQTVTFTTGMAVCIVLDLTGNTVVARRTAMLNPVGIFFRLESTRDPLTLVFCWSRWSLDEGKGEKDAWLLKP